MAPVLVTGFFSGESCQTTAEVTGNHNHSCCATATGSPFFFLVPGHLYMSQLCQMEWGETDAGPWCSALKGHGS